MTPGQFLRRVWPSTGLYCIAHPFTPEGATTPLYVHKVFPTISEAVTHVHEMAHQADTFFAVLSLREAQVWDDTKLNYKTGELGAYAVRLQSNMLSNKTLFFDLDVGTETNKYDTQRDALVALVEFIRQTKMPMPMLVSSGRGVHVYWPFDTEIPADQWRDMAHHMKSLAQKLGLKIDPQRTTDSSSVLRVPQTFNWKDRANPRPVKVLEEGVVTPLVTLRKIISDAMISYGVAATSAPLRKAPVAHGADLGEQKINDFGPPPKLTEVAAACGQVQEILRAQGDANHPHYGQLDNTAWYRGLLQTIRHVEDGDNWCHKLTDLHPRTNADTATKLMQLAQYAPTRCEKFEEIMPWGGTPCDSCRFKGDPSVPNPIAAARRTTPAAAPVVELKVPGMGLQSVLVPDPPKPYERLASGGIQITRTDKDGNSSSSVIYAHDLYPVKRLVNEVEKKEQQLWRTSLPRSGIREFIIDADVLYDPRKFCVAIAHCGIYPNKADIPALQDYMVAYISKLQKEIDADNQMNHLGWSEDYQQFVLPDKTLCADGTVKATALSTAAQRSSQFIRKRGTLARQVELMRFFNHLAYLPNQVAILASLGSIIFHATGHHGIIVNCSGEAGASKSTTIYTGASFWGDPKMWPINGTNRGATANARAQRIATNANLPTPVDEITNIPQKDAVDMAMNITQPGHRLRLNADGQEKAVDDVYKSSIMISSGNSSLHGLLSQDNTAGTAGSMRVFEMKFLPQRVHTKAQADEFLRELQENYGHIGEIFAQFVVTHRAQVEARVQQLVVEIDRDAGIQSSERFWSGFIAVVLVACEIANALGLLGFDKEHLRRWMVKQQVPYMRGVVRDEYRDPLAILTDYIAEKNGNIVVVDRATSIGANTAGKAVAASTAFAVNKPNGALLGHFEKSTGILYLLKSGFKDHCSQIGTSASRLIEELHLARAIDGSQTLRRVIVERNVRRTLGAGTDMAKGQTYCFAVDMNHPEISGTVALSTVHGGGQAIVPNGSPLRAVS